jgi:hypothetical protein
MKARNPIAYVGASLALSALTSVLFSACGSSTCADRGNCTENGGSGGALAGSGGDAGSLAGTENGGASGSGATGGAAGRGGAGHAGDAASAGAAGTSACDGECKGTTPVCDVASNTCVECLKASDCKAATPVCDANSNSCVECAKSSDCRSTSKPACDTTSNTCVACVANADCKDAAKPFCDKAAAQCVACLKQADCTDAKASVCSAGACTACTVDADCADIAGKGVCDAGTCVQCTVAKETVCGGKSCNPNTSTCTNTGVGSIDSCGPCLADSECVGGNQSDPDARCVPMKFMGVPRPSGFCLRRGAKTCVQPYKTPISAASLSGAPSETYCGVDQDATRCEAVLDLLNSRTCADGKDTSCGCTRDKSGNCTDLGVGGLCKTVGLDTNQCTYPCGVTNQCPSGLTCPGAPYCH